MFKIFNKYASGVMPSYELMKSAEQNEVLNKIVSGKKVFY